MTREEILHRIQSTLVEEFDAKPEQVKLEATLADDLGLDSIDAINLAVQIQEIAGRPVTDKELLGLKKVEDAVDLVANMLAE